MYNECNSLSLQLGIPYAFGSLPPDPFAAPGSETPQIRILIVDDDFDHRKILKTRLAAYGYISKEAADGKEGFSQLTQGNFDGVFCDYRMPHMNAIQFIEKVRRTQTVSTIPIIIMTGHSDPGVFEQARAAGATATLSKHFIAAELQAALQLISCRKIG